MPKRRRDQRDKQPRRMKLTERDIEIIHAVYQYRILTQAQLQQLFFSARSPAQRVLARLYHHRLLERKFLAVTSGRSPTLYVLDRKGADLLKQHFGLEDLKWYNSSKDVKTDFLAHTSAINDFRIALTLAAPAAGCELLKWVGESELKAHYDRVSIRTPSGKLQAISLIPDSYFVLQTPRGLAHFFLEADLKSETVRVFKTKVLAYLAYYRSGQYERRYQTKSLRVLTVTTGQRRLDNLKQATEEVGGKQGFYFTTFDQITSAALLTQPLWQVATQAERVPLIAP